MTTGAQSPYLDGIITPTDSLGISDSAELRIEDALAARLVEEFGSPLFIISERTLRANYRRILSAFARGWSGGVNVLYAIKANNNIAVRAILDSEGAGGDCLGVGELYATFAGGAEPRNVVLNGSNKTDGELSVAVELGVLVNIDAGDEVSRLERICAERGSRVRVAVRLKVLPDELNSFASDFFDAAPGTVLELVRREKWGFSLDAAQTVIEAIRRSRWLQLEGYHLHLGRIGQDPEIHRICMGELAETTIELARRTGFAPRVLDIGGGWPRERDPESRTLSRNPHTIEDYADAATGELSRRLSGADLPLPELWLEPGRYLVGNAAVLAGRVGAIKHDLGLTWINVDFSTNNLTRIDSAGAAHTIIPATRLYDAPSQTAIVVGGTCALSVISDEVALPKLARDDVLVALDAGMYAETTSNQYNSLPRPGAALVCDEHVDLIAEPESVADLFKRQRLPDRLRPEGGIDASFFVASPQDQPVSASTRTQGL
jgi:diaminopimelate decarboxylase